MCKSPQRTRNYTTTFQALRAHPGDFIALQDQENGHVTLPQNTPQEAGSGTVYIYCTSHPHDDESFFAVHRAWDREVPGGDGRGRLLAAWSFDGGHCYQVNRGCISTLRQQQLPKASLNPQGADLWCQADIRLPLDITDWYTLYWVWDRPTVSQDLNFAAIKDQMVDL
ncbi:Fc.00g081890.m01.CDS01 [Cosmosporella sp. VM-42]